MPKNQEDKYKHTQKIIQKYRKNVFKTDGVALVCNVCDKNISSERKSQVDQHVKTALHKDRLKNFASRTQQLFLSEMNA